MTVRHEGLWLDDFDMLARVPDENGCLVEALEEGASFGNAQPRTRVIESLMRAGNGVALEGWDNAEPTFQIRITGPTLDAVARTEAKFAAYTRRPAVLKFQPPDIHAEPCFFDVVWSHTQHTHDGPAEKLGRKRYFTLSLEALPFTREQHPRVTPAIEIAADPYASETIPLASAAGWWASSTAGSRPVTASGGAIVTTLDNGGTIHLNRDGALTTAAMPWLTVEYETRVTFPSAFSNGTLDRSIIVDGVTYSPYMVLRDNSPAVGRQVFRAVYHVGGARSGMLLTAAFATPPWPAGYEFRVNTLSRSNKPFSTAPRQSRRSVTVGGSVPTQGTIHVAGAAPLGDVLVYSYPDEYAGFTPALSSYRPMAAAIVPDSSTVSGSWQLIRPAPAQFLVPAAVLPVGTHTVMARVRTGGATGWHRITCRYRTWVNGGPVGPEIVEHPMAFLTQNAWGIVELGQVTLPPNRVGAAGYVEVLLGAHTSETTDMHLDQAWLFPTVGDLTVVNGDGATDLWIEAPSLHEPEGAIWLSATGNRETGFHAQGYAQTWATGHEFAPGGASIYVATTGVVDAMVDLEHYRRWPHHVPREDT